MAGVHAGGAGGGVFVFVVDVQRLVDNATVP